MREQRPKSRSPNIWELNFRGFREKTKTRPLSWNLLSKNPGQWFHGKRQGRGKHSLKGEEYEGEFLSDERHGKGKLAINDVGVYTGEFYQGKRHGEGGMVYSVSLQKQLGTAAGEVRKFTGTFSSIIGTLEFIWWSVCIEILQLCL